jgi:putative SOS response-associated peptidase YedK
MCGRYTLFRLEQLLQSFPWLALPPGIQPRYNIAPTQPVLAVGSDDPGKLDLFRWGMIPSWARDAAVGNKMINARAETLAEKPAFRTALRRRRCLIPADGFYEWRREADGSKTPMHIRMRSEKPFMFAGLWDAWRSPEGKWIRSCTIITTAPNALVATLHDRMPAILPYDRCREWCSLASSATDLPAQPYPAEEMEAMPRQPLAEIDGS